MAVAQGVSPAGDVWLQKDAGRGGQGSVRVSAVSLGSRSSGSDLEIGLAPGGPDGDFSEVMNAKVLKMTVRAMRAKGFAATMCGAVMMATCGAAAAQDAAPSSGDDLILTLGIGGLVSPKFEGSNSYMLSPKPIVKLHYLRLGGLAVGGGPETGPFISPSFRYLASRDASDDKILKGLNSVDWALELGLKVGYEAEYWRAFVAVRRGINGHEGFVADLGADVIARPTPDWTVAAGPRLYLADDEYMDTYFRVRGGESIASGYPVYNPGGGLYAAGAALEVTYAIDERTSLHLNGEYKRLVGDAGDSPIVKVGSADQFEFGLGISYKFGLDLYD